MGCSLDEDVVVPYRTHYKYVYLSSCFPRQFFMELGSNDRHRLATIEEDILRYSQDLKRWEKFPTEPMSFTRQRSGCPSFHHSRTTTTSSEFY